MDVLKVKILDKLTMQDGMTMDRPGMVLPIYGGITQKEKIHALFSFLEGQQGRKSGQAIDGQGEYPLGAPGSV